jgi:uncharacterized membrane protein
MMGLLGAVNVGPVQFDTPIWLWLIPAGWVWCIWFGRSSLSGLGTLTRRVALVVRLIVIVLIAGAMAEPQWKKQSRDVAVTFILDASRSIPLQWQKDQERYVEEARKGNDKAEDHLGVVTVGAEAYVQSLPSKLNQRVERQYIGSDQGTNLAGGVRLALAIKREDAGYRLVLISDGNETAGSLLAAAEAAKAAKVPIDVLPVKYAFDQEVVVDQLVAPSTARMGETIGVRVVIDATQPAVGRLNLLMNGDPIDLDPDSDSMGQVVELKRGRNSFAIPVTVTRAGPQVFKAVFEALPGPGGRIADSIRENNEALTVTFASSEGRVLVVFDPSEEQPSDAVLPLLAALEESKIAAELVSADQMPKSLTELNGYDAIILVNQPAYNFSQQSQEELRQYVHDTGGGLVMLGGPESFGAGGWIGSPLESALPIKLDPPQKRQMPRGALVVISHSIEMPNGVSWGKKTATAAVDALSRLDLAGLVEYQGGAGTAWVHPLSEVGDGSAIKRSINNLVFGDMLDYGPAVQMAMQGLAGVDAGTKHIILISDGDAQLPSTRQFQQLRKERITISTVGVFPHGPGDLARLKQISQQTGGRHYEVVDNAGLGQIVQIFVKEAQTVKRSLIWEGDPFIPSITPIPSETMRGISSVAPLSGYVVAADRESGLALVLLRGKENDPILAIWQHGLGRVVTYTSDATTRWNPAWIGWPGFRAFWEQHVRWAMRPSGSGTMRVSTEKVGDKTRIRVDALDPAGERLNFAKFKGRVAGPGGEGQDVELVQVGPGVYEGMVDTKAAGTYVVSMRYAAPRSDGEGVVEGTVQAAVTKPFADEFRALTDNAPLLQQVAAMTGGKVLSGAPADDAVWRREGITFPVATTPIWLIFALTGIGMFLLDVGVRRVRIDIPGMARAMKRAMKGGKQKAGQQMDALRAAREAAQRAMTERAKAPEAREVEPAVSQKLDGPSAATAKVKFEAPKGRAGASTGPVALGGEPEKKPEKKPAPKGEESKEEGMSRLMKAKKRAQEDMKDE